MTINGTAKKDGVINLTLHFIVKDIMAKQYMKQAVYLMLEYEKDGIIRAMEEIK